MSVTKYWEERQKVEKLYEAWRTNDFRTLFRILLEERGVEICKHGELIGYGHRCPACERELDQLGGL